VTSESFRGMGRTGDRESQRVFVWRASRRVGARSPAKRTGTRAPMCESLVTGGAESGQAAHRRKDVEMPGFFFLPESRSWVTPSPTSSISSSGVAVSASRIDAMFGIIRACCAPGANWIVRGDCVDPIPTGVVSSERGVLILLTEPSASVPRRATKSRITSQLLVHERFVNITTRGDNWRGV